MADINSTQSTPEQIQEIEFRRLLEQVKPDDRIAVLHAVLKAQTGTEPNFNKKSIPDLADDIQKFIGQAKGICHFLGQAERLTDHIPANSAADASWAACELLEQAVEMASEIYTRGCELERLAKAA